MRAYFLRVAVFVFGAAVFAAPHAYGLGVTPLIFELNSGDPSKRATQILVNNDSDRDAPIEVVVFRAELDEDGNQKLKPAPSDFLVFPPTRMLKPHSQQVFRVQWVGPALAKSQTYVLSVNELPVAMPADKSGYKIVFSFDVIANVSPLSGTRTLDIVSSGITIEKGKRYPSLLVSNSGNAHAKLSEATLTLRSGSWSKTLTSGELQLGLGIALVQPGKRRRFKIPVELPLEVKSVAAEISYDKTLR